MGFLIHGLGMPKLGMGCLIHGFGQRARHHLEYYFQRPSLLPLGNLPHKSWVGKRNRKKT